MDSQPAPVWRVFTPVLEIQRLRRENPDRVPEAIDALAGELSAALTAHTTFTRETVEAALATVPDEDVRARLENALETFERVKQEVDAARAELATDRESACAWLESILDSRFAGVTVRTNEDNAFELMPVGSPPGLVPDAPWPMVRLDPAADDDLGPLHGSEFHPAIVARAAALGHDPQRIYEFVGAIEHALYLGHFRAPFEVLAEGLGNAADLAGLLVELLRASGIRSRLVYGPIRLMHRVLTEWLDIARFDVIERALRDSGFTVLLSGSGDAPTIDIIEHYRVRAHLEHPDGARWVDLDPAVRPLEIVQSGRVIRSALPWTFARDGRDDLETEYFATASGRTAPLAFYETRLSEALGLPGRASLDPELRVRRRAPADEAFPPPLPYEPVGFAQEQIAFRTDQEHTIAVQLTGGAGELLRYRFASPGHCGDRIVLRYVPATPTAEALARAAAGPLSIPSFAFDLRPQLAIGDDSGGAVAIVEGNAATPAGAPLHCTFVLRHPAGALTRYSHARPLCGTEWTLRLDGPGTLASAARATAEPDPDDPFVPLVRHAKSSGDFPAPVLAAYHRRLTRAATRIAALGGGVATSGPLLSMAAASLETFVIDGVAARQRPSSILIDVRNVELHLYDSHGQESLQPFVELFLCEGSYHEAQVLEERLGMESMSTVAALREAARQGIPLRVLRPDTRPDIDALDHPRPVKNALHMALGFGGRESIVIPQRPVDFGERRMSTWIARGGTAPSSDYALGGLNGGYGNDKEPTPKPKVKIHDMPNEKLAAVGESVQVGAYATDEEGRDWSDLIVWSAPIAGGGTGSLVSYVPDRSGRHHVNASLGGISDSRSAGFGGGSSDSMEVVTWAAEVRILTFDDSSHELIMAQKGGDHHFGNQHYLRGDIAPAVITARKDSTATLTLLVEPMVRERTFIYVDGIGRSSTGDVLFTLAAMQELDGPFYDEIELRLKPKGIIGIVTKIEWTFSIESQDRTAETEVFVFVAGATAGEDERHEYFVQNFLWACRWAKGIAAGNHEAILDALLKNRHHSRLRFSYARDSGTHLAGLLRDGTGQCPEMAEWFVAMAAVHGIRGVMLNLGMQALTDDIEREYRWKTMRITLPGLNHTTFDEWDLKIEEPVVRKGEYRTSATPPNALYDPWKTEEPFKSHAFWAYSHHVLAYFPDLGLVYDPSMQRGDKFKAPALGAAEYGPTDELRIGYVNTLVAYLLGDIILADGSKVTAFVHAEDVKHEPIRLLFQVRSR